LARWGGVLHLRKREMRGQNDDYRQKSGKCPKPWIVECLLLLSHVKVNAAMLQTIY
jgi:hypothetical protein